MMYRKYLKRLLDFVISLLSLVILSPILLLLCLLVKINMGSPILFKQKRVGMDEKIFTMFKFRTMSNKVNSTGQLLPDEERHTKFGSFLRSSGLDELPELINILTGDLAIVGPRPLLPEYIPYYTERERLRHTVRGGLTQPEVLHNKVMPTWDEQLEYEADYSEKLSFFLDLRIILRTVIIIFGRMKGHYGSSVRKSLVEERINNLDRIKETRQSK